MAVSIRWKLIFLFIVTVAAIMFVFIGGDVISLRRNLIARVDADVNSSMRYAARLMDDHPGLHQADNALQFVREVLEGRRGWLILCAAWPDMGDQPCALAASEDTEKPDPRNIQQNWLTWGSYSASWISPRGERYRLSVSGYPPASPQVMIAVGLSAEDLLATWRKAIWDHVFLALILIAGVFVVAFFFIRQAFRPVRRIVEITKAIEAEDLSLRIDAYDSPDEIGELVRTLNDMIARLEKSFSQVKRFSADVAHELNTPLTALRGELEVVLRRDRSEVDYRLMLVRLLSEVKKLSEIVDDLLFLSVAEETLSQGDGEQTALDRVALEACEDVLPLAREKGIAVHIGRIDETQVRGETTLIKRLIVNLLTNGIKFTNPGGQVHINLALGERVELTVKDTGIGIPESHLPFLFDRFYRVDRSRSRQTGGTGLGLAIVKEIARIYEIEILVRSEVGSGTEVRVRWPPHASVRH